MDEPTSVEEWSELLMLGPRGRRLLLEFALRAERLRDSEQFDDSFATAVMLAATALEPGQTSSTAFFGDVPHPGPLQAISPAEAAARLDEVELPEVTPEVLRACLARSVDAAMYWQPQDGEDLLASTEEMRAALRRVARHVAASDAVAWWRSGVAVQSQWMIRWSGDPMKEVARDPLAELRDARARVIEAESTAARKWLGRPRRNVSGEWWAHPGWAMVSSTRDIIDASPVGLWSVEDSLGWEAAEAYPLDVPAGLRVFEVEGPEAWAALCARFPMVVTAQKQHDWSRVTGREGAWVVPDWSAVAEQYDGVHLQAAAYLSAAGTLIPVDDETASLIAGWNPDETYWFSAAVRPRAEPVRWELDHDDTEIPWVRQ
ncbi:hypothetical protein [Humidisolicoccus flavus]|uniref:hypothetical protein n=1 Tax=Humidisolicoccus flavus TaxID=3111414 RepID=UPI003245E122